MLSLRGARNAAVCIELNRTQLNRTQVVIIAVYAHAYTAGDQLLGAPLSTKLSGLMPIALVRARACTRPRCQSSARA